jgi:chorismate--pyruvate lyase
MNKKRQYHTLQFPVGLDVNWQTISTHVPLNTSLQDWLVDTGSLTERIQGLCKQFTVTVLGQGFSTLHDNERSYLTNQAGDYQVREVLLLADNTPWVFARSIIPSALLEKEWRSLGSAPLGKQLFNDQRFKRGEFQIATLDSHSFAECFSHNAPSHLLFARRSLFCLGQYSVLVAEVFLPDSPAYGELD